MRLDGKVAIVTGGARGIGEGIGRLMIAEGARVFLVDLNADTVSETADRLARAAEGVAADVSDADSAAPMVRTVAERAGTGRAVYGTTKAAIIHLTRQMAIELASKGIRANAVSPGPVDTAMTKEVHTQSQRERYYRQIPLARYGDVEEIARAVAFLASEDASYITGHNLDVDGGFMAAGLLTPEDQE